MTYRELLTAYRKALALEEAVLFYGRRARAADNEEYKAAQIAAADKNDKLLDQDIIP